MTFLVYHKQIRDGEVSVNSSYHRSRQSAFQAARKLFLGLAVPEELSDDEIYYAEVPPGDIDGVVIRGQGATDEKMLTGGVPADPETVYDEVVAMELPTDPYGHLTWTIGDGMDFVALDAVKIDDDVVVLHSVVNSETGSFLMNMEGPVAVSSNEAREIAVGMVDGAVMWCMMNEVETDGGGAGEAGDQFIHHVAELTNKDPETHESN